MFQFENLLRNDYFPEELPPCFSTESFADKHKKIEKNVKNIKFIPSEPVIFSGYKNSNARRKFSIPNPYYYSNLVYNVVENSHEIFRVLEKSQASLTKPTRKIPDKNKAYTKPVYNYADSKERIKKVSQNYLFEMRLDIQTFFDMIYTHSISWAIHGKKDAKKNKNDKNLLGNKLDFLIRNLNGGQTNGVLTGNAVSRIISEIILCTIDSELKKEIPDVEFIRYVDDYFIYTKNYGETTNILSKFRAELTKYQLMLNENKISINESPFMFGKSWVEQMRAYSKLDANILLEKSVIQYHKHKDIAILRYALNIIRTYKFSKIKWNEIEPIIFNILMRFPELTDTIIIILKNNEEWINKQSLKKIIYFIIDTNVLLKNDQEVIWSVWLCMTFKIKMSLKYIKKILNSDNWLAMIIVLDMLSGRKNQTVVKKYLIKLKERIEIEFFSNDMKGMNTEIWLLAYEADKNGWLDIDSSNEFKHARKEKFFNLLIKEGVNFYNSEYTYEKLNIESNDYIRTMYVTRDELINILEEFKLFEKTNDFTILNENEILEKVEKILAKTSKY